MAHISKINAVDFEVQKDGLDPVLVTPNRGLTRSLDLGEEGLMPQSKALPAGTGKRARTWHADDMTPAMIAGYRARFVTYYDSSDPGACWLWTGYHTSTGYPQFCRNSRLKPPRWMAHRMAWVYANDKPLTDQLTVDHLCRVKSCVNPAHLEAVSLAENSARRNGDHSRHGQCFRGHVGRLGWRNGKNGTRHRYCKECRRERYLASKVAGGAA